MSCEDLDELRTSAAHPSTWPEGARAHLKDCPRCGPLQDVLDRIPSDTISETLQARIESTILPGLVPVSPLASASRIASRLILIGLVVTALANWHLGVAGWQARSTLQLLVNFALLAISMGGLAKTIAVRMMPGSADFAPLLSYIAGPLIALIAADVTLFSYRWNPNFFPLALTCWEIGIVCAAIAAPFFWILVRKGFSLNRITQGAAVGLLAGLVGVVVLEIFCPYLDRLHIGAAHIGAAITASLAGAAMGAISEMRQSNKRPRFQ